ncbi:MAG TPA: MmcQ/YjbR family DNA-binding protein [Hyphomonadaceae bacterium]|nr:MmcQ/YjbR family DNA-binding protein [Hyphomonadaceae bacterium]
MTPKQFHEVALSFPETELSSSYGQPAYKAFGKFFTRLRKEDDSIVLATIDFDERDMLCGAEPETFHFTDHYKNYPYVLARLARMDAKRLKGYLTRRWRENAPPKWLKAWEAGDPLPPVVKKAAKPRARKSK